MKIPVRRSRQEHVALGCAVFVGLLTGGQTARATNYCTVLDNQNMVVGEAKGRVWSGGSSYYANAYADGGDEISIPSGITLGKLSTSTAMFDTSIAAFLNDANTGGCGNFTITLTVGWDQTGTLTCDGPDGSGTASWSVNTCGLPNGDLFQGSRAVRLTGWTTGTGSTLFNVKVYSKDGGITRASETSGCFYVEPSTGCTGL